MPQLNDNLQFTINNLNNLNVQDLDESGCTSITAIIENPDYSFRPKAKHKRTVHAKFYSLPNSNCKIIIIEETSRTFERWRFPLDVTCILHTSFGDFKCDELTYSEYPMFPMLIASPLEAA